MIAEPERSEPSRPQKKESVILSEAQRSRMMDWED